MPLTVDIIPILGDNYVYLITCSESGESVVVDPGAYEPVSAHLKSKNIKLDKIFCTHHHHDHIGGVSQLKQEHQCQVWAAKADAKRIPDVDYYWEIHDEVVLGHSRGCILDTPGHTIGHISIHFPADKFLFCGDTLFSGGCGRLFEGSAEQMHNSFAQFAQMPDDTQVYCGHEYTKSNIAFARSVLPDNTNLENYQTEILTKLSQQKFTIPTSIGLEKKINLFLMCNSPEVRQSISMENASDIEVFAQLRKMKDQF